MVLLKKGKSSSVLVYLPDFVKSPNIHSSNNKHSNKTSYHDQCLKYICPNYSFETTLNTHSNITNSVYTAIGFQILYFEHNDQQWFIF